MPVKAAWPLSQSPTHDPPSAIAITITADIAVAAIERTAFSLDKQAFIRYPLSAGGMSQRWLDTRRVRRRARMVCTRCHERKVKQYLSDHCRSVSPAMFQT